MAISATCQVMEHNRALSLKPVLRDIAMTSERRIPFASRTVASMASAERESLVIIPQGSLSYEILELNPSE